MTRLPVMGDVELSDKGPSIHLLPPASEVGGPDLASYRTGASGADLIF